MKLTFRVGVLIKKPSSVSTTFVTKEKLLTGLLLDTGEKFDLILQAQVFLTFAFESDSPPKILHLVPVT